MRQKYVISRNDTKRTLKIKEYAVIDKDLKKVASQILKKDHFTFLSEEIYEKEFIINSINSGIGALVAILRTHNIFPIEPYITEIAESVMNLYESSEDGTVELFFDDLDLLPGEI